MKNKFIWGIGLGAIIFACIAMTIVTSIGQLVFHLQPSEVFALGQLLVEILLFPTVVIGFIFTIIQFKASEQISIPRLYWEMQTDQLTECTVLCLKRAQKSNNTLRLVVRNKGKAITTWYLLRFEIPSKLYEGHETEVKRLIGDKLNRSLEDDSHWYFTYSKKWFTWSFMSNGEYALYPDYSQPLCTLTLFFDGNEECPSSYVIPYTIYSDKGREEKGELRINLTKDIVA